MVFFFCFSDSPRRVCRRANDCFLLSFPVFGGRRLLLIYAKSRGTLLLPILFVAFLASSHLFFFRPSEIRSTRRNIVAVSIAEIFSSSQREGNEERLTHLWLKGNRSKFTNDGFLLYLLRVIPWSVSRYKHSPYACSVQAEAPPSEDEYRSVQSIAWFRRQDWVANQRGGKLISANWGAEYSSPRLADVVIWRN